MMVTSGHRCSDNLDKCVGIGNPFAEHLHLTANPGLHDRTLLGEAETVCCADGVISGVHYGGRTRGARDIDTFEDSDVSGVINKHQNFFVHGCHAIPGVVAGFAGQTVRYVG
ncbi:hypothetical protein HXW97_04335 [Mycobacterium marinum]|nr:hypothetical protein [Mycobacterium marinum]QQW33148.1 hypothetical protein HXW97_04335 [Mycobacterium marinum]